MIKKAALLLLTAPFLMVFSDFSYSAYYVVSTGFTGATPAAACSARASSFGASIVKVGYSFCKLKYPNGNKNTQSVVFYSGCTQGVECVSPELDKLLKDDPTLMPKKTDEECELGDGDSYSTSSPDTYNYLAAGGSVNTHSGACSVSSAGGVSGCTGSSDNLNCSLNIKSESTGEYGNFGQHITGGLDPSSESDGSFSVVDFDSPSYLNKLPGGCSDSSSCVTIGNDSFLVDWDSAPDYFEYVDSNGTVHSKPSSGGDGGDTGGDGGDDGGDAGGDGGGEVDPTDPTDPTDPGGDNGDGSSGGGSSVPDFEFDESGIIEAIGSAGRSNRNAINAMSSDVTGALADQTRDLNEATNAQTDTLTGALDDQTTNVTDTLNNQTSGITSSLDALGTTFTDALKGLGSIEDGSGDSDGDGEAEGEDDEGKGLLGGISKLLNGMVNKLALKFTEDLGSDNELFDSSGMDETLEGASEEQAQYGDDVRGLMDQIGDEQSSSIAEKVTSLLPSLPSGSCTPMQFGPMEISCRAFTTIQQWLTWIVYFWTVVSVVDTFFRSGQRTA